jgi:hypothetical protein
MRRLHGSLLTQLGTAEEIEGISLRVTESALSARATKSQWLRLNLTDGMLNLENQL